MPAYGNSVLDKGYDAGAAILNRRFVKFTAEDVVGPVTATSDVPVGVSMFAVDAAGVAKGKGMSVRGSGGIAECEVGTGGVTTGALVSFDNTGKVIPATTGTRIVGVALQTRLATQHAAVRLQLPGYISP